MKDANTARQRADMTLSEGHLVRLPKEMKHG